MNVIDDLLQRLWALILLPIGLLLAIFALYELQHDLEIIKFLLGFGLIGAVVALVFIKLFSKH